MAAVNKRKGLWWCPYCVSLRRFVKRNTYVVSGQKVTDPHLACPMCGVSHRDGAVSRYNPLALYVTARVQRPKTARRTRTTKENE